MRKIFFIILSMLVCLPNIVNAKELIKKEIKFNDIPKVSLEEVLATDDGGYIVAGLADSDALIVKYDKDDKVEWYKTFDEGKIEGFFDIEVTPKGGYLAVGVSTEGSKDSDSLLVEFDKLGNVIYQKIFVNDGRDYFADVEYLDNGDYLIVGSKSMKGHVIKLNSSHNVILDKEYSSISEFNGFTCDKEGNIIAVGYTAECESSVIYKLGKNGVELWRDVYGDGISVDDENLGISLISNPHKYGFMEVVEHPNGGYIVVGSVWSNQIENRKNRISLNGRVPVVVKYTEKGNVEWTNEFPTDTSYNGTLMDISLTDDGGYYLSGSVVSDIVIDPDKDETLGISLSVEGEPLLVKVNSNHEFEWKKAYKPYTMIGALYSVDVINGSEFVTAGSIGALDFNDFFQRVGTGIIIKNNYKFVITKEKTKNGTFEVDEYNYKATIKSVAEKGYVVDSIKVVDSQNKEVKVTKNEDGTYSYDINDDTWVTVTFREYTITCLDTKNGVFDAIKDDITNGKITVQPNKGFELGKVIVKDSTGKELKVTKNEDGTYSFDLNDDVTVEVLFNEIPGNPKTGLKDYFVLLFMIPVCVVVIYFVNKKKIFKRI